MEEDVVLTLTQRFNYILLQFLLQFYSNIISIQFPSSYLRTSPLSVGGDDEKEERGAAEKTHGSGRYFFLILLQEYCLKTLGSYGGRREGFGGGGVLTRAMARQD